MFIWFYNEMFNLLKNIIKAKLKFYITSIAVEYVILRFNSL